ncbi:MAG: hypothetical protein ACFFD1_08880 [Candidatus Thorarchaeota archaeon]
MDYSYYIDEDLRKYEKFINGSFEGIQKLLHLGKFIYYFSGVHKSENLLGHLQSDLRNIKSLDNTTIESFLENFQINKISFSWGFEDVQYVFIIISEDEKYLLENPVALIGLLVHETMHGIERLRGLEDDLNRNMRFTQEFFIGFMKLLPEYPQEFLEKILLEVAQTSVFVLKEWYANRELIERDYTSELLYYYEILFGLSDEPNQGSLPILDISLPDIVDPKEINLMDFSSALNFFLSLTSAYVPFLRMHTSSFARTTAEKIKRFIYTRYPNLHSVAKELRHLEDLYLTEFAYTKNFQQSFYTEIFSIVYRYLGGKSFLIWHYVDIVNSIEQLPDFSNKEQDDTLKDVVLIPVLKAASIFSKKNVIPSDLLKGLQEKMQTYINKDELNEWNETWEDFDIYTLLLLPLQHLVEKLREKFLESIQDLRDYSKIILSILNLLKGQGQDSLVFEWRSSLLKFISERDSRFSSLVILLPLEFSIKNNLFSDPYVLTHSEAKEALFLFRYYAVSKTNYNINLMIKIAKLLKFSLSKIDLTKPEESGEAIAMTVSMFLMQDPETVDLTYTHIIFKLLLEILPIPIKIQRIASKTFGGLLQSQEEKIDGMEEKDT